MVDKKYPGKQTAVLQPLSPILFIPSSGYLMLNCASNHGVHILVTYVDQFNSFQAMTHFGHITHPTVLQVQMTFGIVDLKDGEQTTHSIGSRF